MESDRICDSTRNSNSPSDSHCHHHSHSQCHEFSERNSNRTGNTANGLGLCLTGRVVCLEGLVVNVISNRCRNSRSPS